VSTRDDHTIGLEQWKTLAMESSSVYMCDADMSTINDTEIGVELAQVRALLPRPLKLELGRMLRTAVRGMADARAIAMRVVEERPYSGCSFKNKLVGEHGELAGHLPALSS
jgi:hypothetical protein